MGETNSIAGTEISEITMGTNAGKSTSKTVSTTRTGTNDSRFKGNKRRKGLLAPIYQHFNEQTST